MKAKARLRVRHVIGAALVIAWSLAPIIWILVSSLSTRAELYSIPPHWLPHQPTLDAYNKVLISGAGFRGGGGVSAAVLMRLGLRNSFIIAIFTTFFVMMVAPTLGFAYSRLRFRGRQLFFYLTLAIIAIPGWPVLIGLFSEYSSLGLLDTRIGLILLSFTYRLPFETWFMKGYFDSVPAEIEDAARIDGCSLFQTLYRVSIHVIMPGVIAVAIISFLFTWNLFAPALVLTYTLKAKTITVAMTEFISQYYVNWDLMSAGTIIALILPVTVTLIFQRYIVRGLTAGAVKS